MATSTEFIHVSVREARMAVERILLTCGIAKGYVPAVRDAVLLSQSLGLGGFERLRADRESLVNPALSAMKLHERRPDDLLFDGGGLHAWLVLPTACDLAVAAARRCGRAEMQLRHVVAPGELAVLAALAQRQGAQAQVQPVGDGASVRLSHAPRPRTIEDSDPWLMHAIRHGWPFGREAWREIYALSNKALAPDSVLSRRHAGPVLVDEQGRLVGRVPVDDETDLRTLTSV